MSKSYLAQHVVNLKPSGIRKFFDIVATMQDVISLGIGEPDFCTPDHIIQAGIRSLKGGDTHYTSNAGRIELRRALCAHLEKLHGVRYDPQTEIVVTVGVSEALYLSMNALLNPGEEVIIPTPCFVSYQAEVILAGGVAVELPTYVEDGFQVRAEALEAAITPKTKAILIGYPNNPTGAVASRQALLDIARIAEAHNLVVISDELYDQLVYGVPHVCFAALPGMWERTIHLGGFSKNYAMTGWRVGFAAGPADIIRGLVTIHQYTIMSAPTIAQEAALEAIVNGHEHVEAMRAEYDRRRKLIVRRAERAGPAHLRAARSFLCLPGYPRHRYER
jgi:aminotransferase